MHGTVIVYDKLGGSSSFGIELQDNHIIGFVYFATAKTNDTIFSFSLVGAADSASHSYNITMQPSSPPAKSPPSIPLSLFAYSIFYIGKWSCTSTAAHTKYNASAGLCESCAVPI